MKKILLVLMLTITLNACYTTYQISPQKYDYSNSISFTIDKIEEGYSISTGSGSICVSKGYKFVFLHVTAKNDFNKKQELDYDNIYLLDLKNKTKHKVELAMIIAPINMGASIHSSIRKGDTKKRKLVYIFPEQEKAQYLMINNQTFEIKYL